MIARCPIASRAYIIIYILTTTDRRNRSRRPAAALMSLSGCHCKNYPPPATNPSPIAGLHTHFIYLRQVFILSWFCGVPPVFMVLRRPIAAPLAFLKCKDSKFVLKSKIFPPNFLPKNIFSAAHNKNRESSESRELPIASLI